MGEYADAAISQATTHVAGNFRGPGPIFMWSGIIVRDLIIILLFTGDY